MGASVRFSLSFRPILAPTEDEAWARAERIKQRIIELRAKAGLGAARSGQRRIAPPACRRRARRASGQAAVDRGRAADRRARQHHQPGRHAAAGGRGIAATTTTSAVTTFLIRGFDPLNDAIEYGRDLLPLTKRLIAERATAQVAA